MSLIPIQKALDVSNRNSAYIFSCPYRSFPVIISYQLLKLLAEINNVSSVSLFFEIHEPSFFDNFECGVGNHAIGQLACRGYLISELSRLTEIQPLEIAMYYSGLVSADEVTMKIIFDRTGNFDMKLEPMRHYYGEWISDF